MKTLNLKQWEVRAALEGRLRMLARPVVPQPPEVFGQPPLESPVGAPGDVFAGRETFVIIGGEVKE